MRGGRDRDTGARGVAHPAPGAALSRRIAKLMNVGTVVKAKTIVDLTKHIHSKLKNEKPPIIVEPHAELGPDKRNPYTTRIVLVHQPGTSVDTYIILTFNGNDAEFELKAIEIRGRDARQLFPRI